MGAMTYAEALPLASAQWRPTVGPAVRRREAESPHSVDSAMRCAVSPKPWREEEAFSGRTVHIFRLGAQSGAQSAAAQRAEVSAAPRGARDLLLRHLRVRLHLRGVRGAKGWPPPQPRGDARSQGARGRLLLHRTSIKKRGETSMKL